MYSFSPVRLAECHAVSVRIGSGKHTTLGISNPGDLLQGIGFPADERLKEHKGNAGIT